MQNRHYEIWPKNLPYSLSQKACSVYDNLINSAKRVPERTAIKFYGNELTYKEVIEQVKYLAGYFYHSMNIRENDRVALYMQNSPQFVIAYYSVLAANAVIVPVNPMYKNVELEHILKDSNAKALIFGDELVNEVINSNVNIEAHCFLSVSYSEYIGQKPGLDVPDIILSERSASSYHTWLKAMEMKFVSPTHNRSPNDWCIIPYSSGTTGKPKGCLHTHRSVNATANAYPTWLGVNNGSQILATLPLYHVTGMQHSMNLPIVTGSTIHLMMRWNPKTAATIIEKEKVQHWRSITTTMIDFLSLKNIESYDLSSLEAIGGGGAQMPLSLAERMENLLGLDYIEAYGLTETMAPIHINPITAPRKQCLGIPIFGVDSRIIEPKTENELGPNEIGEIITSGPQVFHSYWKDEKATRDAFIKLGEKVFFRTGDIGYYDEQGYFYFVDRLKRMINVSGLKVWPAEVEAILHSHPDILEACVVGDPDYRTGEKVRAVVVLSDEKNVLLKERFIDWCIKNMAAYKVPSVLEIRKFLPRSSAGKVLWKDL